MHLLTLKGHVDEGCKDGERGIHGRITIFSFPNTFFKGRGGLCWRERALKG